MFESESVGGAKVQQMEATERHVHTGTQADGHVWSRTWFLAPHFHTLTMSPNGKKKKISGEYELMKHKKFRFVSVPHQGARNILHFSYESQFNPTYQFNRLKNVFNDTMLFR